MKWLGLMIMGCALATAAQASNVYRWVDEHGNVHYGDRPVQQAEKIEIRNSQSSPRPRKQKEDLSIEPEQDDPAPSTPYSQGKQSASAQERCKEFKARLAQYKSAGTLETVDRLGNRSKLNPEERKQLVDNTARDANKACSEADES